MFSTTPKPPRAGLLIVNCQFLAGALQELPPEDRDQVHVLAGNSDTMLSFEQRILRTLARSNPAQLAFAALTLGWRCMPLEQAERVALRLFDKLAPHGRLMLLGCDLPIYQALALTDRLMGKAPPTVEVSANLTSTLRSTTGQVAVTASPDPKWWSRHGDPQ
jgi:hypothetical protein